MSEIFVDSFYYIALLNPADQHHAVAVQATRELRGRLVTTIWVLMEVADALSDPSVRERTNRLLDRIVANPQTVAIVDVEPWFSRGRRLFGQRSDKSWSLTDCISFEVMSERLIREALTGDRHFTQAGFNALLCDRSTH